MTSKHTPAPWYSAQFDNSDADYAIDISAYPDCAVPLATVCGACEEEVKANASLISAAPKLLAFAEAFCELFNDSDMCPEDECYELYGEALDLIAEARGE